MHHLSHKSRCLSICCLAIILSVTPLSAFTHDHDLWVAEQDCDACGGSSCAKSILTEPNVLGIIKPLSLILLPESQQSAGLPKSSSDIRAPPQFI